MREGKRKTDVHYCCQCGNQASNPVNKLGIKLTDPGCVLCFYPQTSIMQKWKKILFCNIRPTSSAITITCCTIPLRSLTRVLHYMHLEIQKKIIVLPRLGLTCHCVCDSNAVLQYIGTIIHQQWFIKMFRTINLSQSLNSGLNCRKKMNEKKWEIFKHLN